jgi:pimeloyl-ACP methyl ester carboxylesterase
MQEFTIPIGELKFSGGTSGGDSNELRIDIDVGNAGNGIEAWCTSVDWVAVKLDVAAPYVLAHGINADASTWDEKDAPGVISYLNDLGVAWNRFSVPANGSVIGNAGLLGSQINTWLKTMRSDRVHIIAHSKGGLDSQAMVANTQDFKVLSLSTLSTPHYGSVVSDITSLEIQKIQQNINSIQNNSPDPNGYVNSLLNDTYQAYYVHKSPLPPGLWNLKTDAAMPAIMRMERGNIWQTFSIGASADLNGNHKMEGFETVGIVGGSIGAWYLNDSYQVLLNYSRASLVIIKNGRLEFFTAPAPELQENDIFVAETSANPSWATPLGNVMANHSTIKSGANVHKLIDNTISLGRE